MRSSVLMLAGVVGVALGGCGLQKQPRGSVLRTEDFIADPATMPTQAIGQSPAPEPAARPAAVETPAGPEAPRVPPPMSALAASDGLMDAVALPGDPDPGEAPPDAVGPQTMVDAKVGEINGRPIRVSDMLDRDGSPGPRIAAAARSRRLSLQEWEFLRQSKLQPGEERRALTREDWLKFTRMLMAFELDRTLQDDLLAEEARFSLKPEQQQGLKYFVTELTENTRRQAGGTQAQAAQKLREKNLTPQEYAKQLESILLIDFQLAEKIRKRVNVSWKDVRLYYERHPELYNPPAKVYFRMIRVPTEKAEDVAAIRAALDSGKPFAEVAAMPQNDYKSDEGGMTPPWDLTGPFGQGEFFSGALRAAAQGLTVGAYTTQPVEEGGRTTWLFLERVDDRSIPLSNRDVQLDIANRLTSRATELERTNYIRRLKERASFSDIEDMARRLTDIAAARWWPKE